MANLAVQDSLISGVVSPGLWVKLTWNGDGGATAFISNAQSDSNGIFLISAAGLKAGKYTVYVSRNTSQPPISDPSWTATGRTSFDVSPIDDTGKATFPAAVDMSVGPLTVSANALPEAAIANLVGDLSALASGVAAAAVDAATVHKAFAETITGVKVFSASIYLGGPDPVADVVAFGALGDNSTDDATALQNALNAAKHILFPANRTYLTSAHLVYKGGTHLEGLGSALGPNPAWVKMKNSSNITAAGGLEGVFVADSWNTNQTLCDQPVIIENLKIDGNRANNGSGQACGIVLYNFWSHIRGNYILNTNKHGVLLTDTGRDGSTHLTNTASENRVYKNHFENTGLSSFRQIVGASIGTNLDGFCDDNTIDSPLGSGIEFDQAAGWSVRRNHGYGIKKHFIYAPKCFATVIANNDTDDFGTEGTGAATYYGIYATSVPGAKPSRGGHIHDNSLDCTEAGGTSIYHYYWFDDVGVTGTAHMSPHDNAARYSGSGTSAGFFMTLNASAATWIYDEHGNVALNLATGRRVLISSTGQVRRPPLIPSARPASGQYLATPFNNIVTVQLTTLNAAVFVPVDVASEQTFTGISFNLNTVGTGAGQVARLALFGDDGTFTAPGGSPIEDLGTTSTLATTGNRDVAFAAARKLLPARYWLAVVIQGVITLGPTLTSANSGQDIALPQTTLDNSVQARCWSQSGVSGAFGAVASLFGTSASPMLALKAQ